MANVIPFDFEGGKVRIIMRGEEPWFVLADVCRALGLGDHKGAYAHHADKLDDDEKRLADRDTVMRATPGLNLGVAAEGLEKIGGFGVDATDSLLREKSAWLISESGLYTLILRCREATTKGTLPYRFRRWVTAEVLPTIRRTGRYEMPVSIETSVSVAVATPAVPAAREVLSSRERNSHIALCKLVYDLFGPEKAAAIYQASPLPKVEGAVAPPALEVAEMDGPGCLAHLLRTKVARSNRTMADMVLVARRDPYTRSRLAATGVLVNPEGWPGHVAIANQHPRLQYVFTDTVWAQDWRSALLTLASAQISPGGMGFGGVAVGAVLLPWDIVELFLDRRAAA